MKQSKAEREFRTKFPNTRVSVEESAIRGMDRYTVYAGDYLCAQALSAARAFRAALDYDAHGIITPDPLEVAHGPLYPSSVPLLTQEEGA